MMQKNNSTEVFFELLRAGLWEREVQLSKYKDIAFEAIYTLAEEQSVVGLITAGLEHVKDVKIPQKWTLQFIGNTLQIEQRNKAMNQFIEELITKMRDADIYTLLVKGQGVAQCYERPLWRASGDIDFYMSESTFKEAKNFFRPLVSKFEPDYDFAQHINMQYGEWVVEIHANQRCTLSSRINKVLDQIHKDLFYCGNVRSWMNGKTQVFLPFVDSDVLLSFTHFLNHFYKGGLGIRQICDWCRLLWTFKSKIDHDMLNARLIEMGLISEWRAFGTFAVEYLGMPAEAMPMYDSQIMGQGSSFAKKADRICDFIMEVGNFGHNRDTSYYGKYPFIVRKAISAWWRVKDLCRHARIFPLDSLRFFLGIMWNGVCSAARGV